MTQLAGSDEKSIKSEGELPETLWSNDLDHVPLIARQKMLLESKQHLDSNNPKSGRTLRSLPDDDGDEKENSHYASQVIFSFPSTCPTMEGGVQHLEPEKCNAGQAPGGVTSEVQYCKAAVDFDSVNMCSQKAGCDQYVPGDCHCFETQLNTCSYSVQKSCAEANAADVVGLEKVNAGVYTLHQNSTISEVPVQLKLKCFDTDLSNSLGDAIHVAVADVPVIKAKSEVLNDFSDDLDNIVLKERQRMLLQRKLLGLQRTVLEGDSGVVSRDPGQHLGGKGNGTICLVDGKLPSVAANQLYDFPPRNASDRCRISRINSSNGSSAGSPLPRYRLGTESSEPKSDMEVQGTDRIRASKRRYSELNSRGGQNYEPNNTISALSSRLSTSVKVKVEPLDNNDLHNSVGNTVGNFSSTMLPMKREQEKSDEFFDDVIDHMHLRDRMKLPMLQDVPDLNMSMNFECSSKSVPSDMQSSPSVSESVKSVSIKCRRKRKKTATDSVETALEEDAPGLLQVLIDKGVLVDEIKLYGEMESDEALDESFSEDSFSELESVISKLFFQRHSFLKFPPLRCTKSSKTRYCLTCLISLVEQTRYLQFRKWPVEWGWCRDLQSFIFVFERHNRIVLERPEYGYATYFFELVNSLPINWQIKRLVTAMKLTSCSRVALIENKALMVGDDMTEGEAQVLMQYGWLPNSGLGTMLNYCDRVVHDWKNEDISEWRSKMGKMLMNGYNGGCIISNKIPHKFTDYRGTESPEIKLEEL